MNSSLNRFATLVERTAFDARLMVDAAQAADLPDSLLAQAVRLRVSADELKHEAEKYKQALGNENKNSQG
jgi:predicted ATP-grasp superfamily ATP-dependent carboligase